MLHSNIIGIARIFLLRGCTPKHSQGWKWGKKKSCYDPLPLPVLLHFHVLISCEYVTVTYIPHIFAAYFVLLRSTYYF